MIIFNMDPTGKQMMSLLIGSQKLPNAEPHLHLGTYGVAPDAIP